MPRSEVEDKLSADVSAVKAGKKVCYVDVFVHKQLATDLFVVGDNTASIIMDLTDKPEFGKHVSSGKCFRLPKPALRGEHLVLGERFGPCPIKLFSVQELSEADLSRFQPKELDITDIQRLSDVCDVSADTTVSLYLKAVFVSTEKKGRYSQYKIVKVKDVYGDKHFLQVFGPLRLEVEEGVVYRFNSILVQNYRKDGEKWGRMRTQSDTKIRPVSEEVNALFSLVSLGDAFLGGVVIGHESIHYYECCGNCHKKNHLPSGSRNRLCQFCGSKSESDSAFHDFSVNLILSNDSGNELTTVFAFRSHLGIEFDSLNAVLVQ